VSRPLPLPLLNWERVLIKTVKQGIYTLCEESYGSDLFCDADRFLMFSWRVVSLGPMARKSASVSLYECGAVTGRFGPNVASFTDLSDVLTWRTM